MPKDTQGTDRRTTPVRLVWKLTAALAVAMCSVLVVSENLSVRKQVAILRTDMKSDHETIGRAIGAAVMRVWRSDGEGEALRMLVSSNLQRVVHIRWVRLGEPPNTPFHPHEPEERLAEVAEGRSVSLIDGDRLYTYVPLIHGHRLQPQVVIELSESIASERQYARGAVIGAVYTTLVLLSVAGLLALGLGVWLVGRPVRALIAQARRVGAGDLSGRIEMRRRDELGELAEETNMMCERLAEARDRVAAETSARIAALEQLRHADRLATVGKLSSGIAHEMGTPLNVVGGRAQMIVSGDAVGEEVVDNARIIVAQVERMTRSIRQLLDFARRRSPRKETHDVRQVVRQTALLMQPIADKQRVVIETEEDAQPVLARIDAGQIQQALTNLVLNAIQAMPRGGRVRIRLSREHAEPPAGHEGQAGEVLRIAVRDEGEGIPAEIRDRVFEPFFTTKGIGEGTGLGLSVSYGIVREHGGWIDVESEPGKGSCFSIALPMESDG
jgi:two-component system, NtrC family, sensor kinase